MKKKRITGIVLFAAVVILVGSCLIYARLYDGHDLASQTRMVRRACGQNVTLYSSTILGQHGPDAFKDSIGFEAWTEIVEIHAEDGRHGYAVFLQNAGGGKDLLTTNLYSEDVSQGFLGIDDKFYGIFQCQKPDINKLVVTVVNDDTGESVTEEYEMNGYHIYVAELPGYKSCTVHSRFYDVHGNMFEYIR